MLREAVELKKLNNNLMKVTMLEDLTADIYARLFEENRPRFAEQANEENRERMKVDHILMNTDGATDETTPATSAPQSEAPNPPRGRTKGIARRDIQKRAEAIVTRHARPAAAKTTTAAAEEEKPPSAAVARLSTVNTSRDAATEGASAAQSSVPASLHDSADDESELSEIDDEKLDKLKTDQSTTAIFPNFNKSLQPPEPTSELSAPASADGDEAATTETADVVPVAEDYADENAQDQEGEMEGETVLTAEEEGEETELQAGDFEGENMENPEGDAMDGEEGEQADGDDEEEEEDEVEGGEAEGDATEIGDETMVDVDEEQAEEGEGESEGVKDENPQSAQAAAADTPTAEGEAQ